MYLFYSSGTIQLQYARNEKSANTSESLGKFDIGIPGIYLYSRLFNVDVMNRYNMAGNKLE